MKMKLICLLLAFFRQLAVAQEDKENIVKEFTFPNAGNNNVLYIENINGGVTVEGYSGNKVLVEVEKILKARNEEDLEKARKEVKLGIEQSGDSIKLYIDNPYVYRRKDGRIRYDFDNDWNQDYNYIFNYKVKVPHQTTLAVFTVNKGNITVANTIGRVHASNVNGSITLQQITGKTRANTINGDIKATYTAIPPENSDYKTLNGDIEISYPQNLSADLRFKTTNGEAYTDFAIAENLPVTLQKGNTHKGTTYKLEGNSGIRIGKGGLQHSFEVFNGDITIKRSK